MKFSIDSTVLKELLEDLYAVTGSKSLINPILTHVKVDVRPDKVIFFASNQEVSIAREVDTKSKETGALTFPAKSMLELVRSFAPDKNVTLSLLANSRLQVSQSRSRYRLSSADPFTYPKIDFPAVEYAPMSSEAIIEAVSKVSHSMAGANEVRAFLQATLFEPTSEEGFMRAVTSDGHRLTTCKVPGVIPAPFLIPKDSIPTLKRVLSSSEEVGMFLEPTKVNFKLKDGFISFRLYENKFPNYKPMLDGGSFYKTVNFLKDEFMEALNRVVLVSNEISSCVTLDISSKDAFMHLKANRSECDGEEVVPLLPSEVKEDTTISFNGKYLQQALSKFDKDEISMRIFTELKPAIFQDGSNILGVVMPIVNR